MDGIDNDTLAVLFKAIETSDWKYAASILLALTVRAVREPIAKWFPFAATDPGGVLLVVFLGSAFGVVHALVAHMPIDGNLANAVAKIIAAAIAQYVVVKKLWPNKGKEITEKVEVEKAKEEVVAETVVPVAVPPVVVALPPPSEDKDK